MSGIFLFRDSACVRNSHITCDLHGESAQYSRISKGLASRYRNYMKDINDHSLNILRKVILVANHTFSDPRNRLKLILIIN